MERRSPSGERGLKSLEIADMLIRSGRSPSGERGLKCVGVREAHALRGVAPHPGSVD